MMTRRQCFLPLLATAAAASVAAGQEHAFSTARKVTLRGRVDRVQLAMGQGMPVLDLVDAEGKRHRIMLGSMRYLMEKNFNPKAGQQAIVTGFAQSDFVVAQKVEIPSEKIVLPLRNEDGTPLWRRRGASKKN